MLALTLGDPAGIGPEIVTKALAARQEHHTPICLFTHRSLWTPPAGLAKSVSVHYLAEQDFSELRLGQASAASGRAALASLEAAAQAVATGKCQALVTAPLNKTAIALAGCPHPGHTEWLAEFCQSEVAMMFAADLGGKSLNVLLASIHVPLSEAIRLITPELILKRLQQAQAGAKLLGYDKPRIAVAGLNPHASEDGLFGHEEASHILPGIAAAQAQGINVSGPYPPDTVYMRALAGEFDLVLAMSHDQGLIPVKLLGWERAVNITVGLPFLRVSVDHGTAYDIAGKGLADARNLMHVLQFVEHCLKRHAR